MMWPCSLALPSPEYYSRQSLTNLGRIPRRRRSGEVNACCWVHGYRSSPSFSCRKCQAPRHLVRPHLFQDLQLDLQLKVLPFSPELQLLYPTVRTASHREINEDSIVENVFGTQQWIRGPNVLARKKRPHIPRNWSPYHPYHNTMLHMLDLREQDAALTGGHPMQLCRWRWNIR